MISLREAFTFITSTESIYSPELLQGFNGAFFQLGSSLVSIAFTLFMLTYYLLVVLLKLSVMLLPHTINTLNGIYVFHRTKLSMTDIFVEILVVSLVGTFLFFKKRIVIQWRIFEKYVAKKSKAAAKAAPHVAFFTLSLLISIIGRKFLVHVTSESVLPIVTLLIPIYTTLKELYASSPLSTSDSDITLHADNSNNGKRMSITPVKPVLKETALNQKLTLWVVLAAYHTLATTFSLVPFSSKIAAILPSVRELAVVVIIWSQLSSQFTDIVFESCKPLLRCLANTIPASNFGSTSGASFVSILRMMNLVNHAQEMYLKSLLQDSFLSLLAILFLFLPWRIAYVGVIIVALLFPAFRSSNTILGYGNVRGTTAQRSVEEGIDETKRWLEYWICAGCMWSARCYGFRMWPSVMMLCALWLQHSWFRGASTVLGIFRSHWSALVNRHHRIAHQRKERVEEIVFDKTTSSSSTSSTKRHRIDQQQHHNDNREYEMIDRSEENEHVDKELHDIDTGNGQYDQQNEDNPGARTPTPILLRRQQGSNTSTSTGTNKFDLRSRSASSTDQQQHSTFSSSAATNDEEMEGKDR